MYACTYQNDQHSYMQVVGRSETYDAVKFALAEQKLKPYNTTLLLSESQGKNILDNTDTGYFKSYIIY